MHGIGQQCRAFGPFDRLDHAVAFGHEAALGNDLLDGEAFRAVDEQNIGLTTWRYQANLMVDLAGNGAVDGRHLDRRHRRNTCGNGHAHHIGRHGRA